MSSSLEALRAFREEQNAAYAELARQANPVGGNRPWSRPLKSDALAVHPKKVKEATDDAAKKGVPTDFDSEGRPEFRDRNHRRRYCEAYGYFDRAGGYGDAQRGGTRMRDVAKEIPVNPNDYTDMGLVQHLLPPDRR